MGRFATCQSPPQFAIGHVTRLVAGIKLTGDISDRSFVDIGEQHLITTLGERKRQCAADTSTRASHHSATTLHQTSLR